MRAQLTLLAASLVVAAAAPASAQPIARADATAVVGWFNAHQPDPSEYDDWYNRSAYGGAQLGWYWTDHLKTEVDLGATSAAELYSYQPINVGGQQTYVSSRRRFSTRRVAAGQQYQFLRNAWVHPHVAVGLDLTAETSEQRFDPVVVYDPISRTSRTVQPVRTTGPSTDLRVRPFAEIGAKLYFSRRGFVRTDLRVTFRDSVEEVLVRFGMGIDF